MAPICPWRDIRWLCFSFAHSSPPRNSRGSPFQDRPVAVPSQNDRHASHSPILRRPQPPTPHRPPTSAAASVINIPYGIISANAAR
jgi:hypothetical protein